ncbi:hypothetical protein QCA50_007612 [Cerrena zonata]|uniref:Uncharacterized protein n=1 Tax=Cerrena zonata TaxID=2478898 RepID=A0AAW0GHJ5_9APHY
MQISTRYLSYITSHMDIHTATHFFTAMTRKFYTIYNKGTNLLGNHYWSFVDNTGGLGYHYSNANGSWYYKNTDGSRYYNDGKAVHSTSRSVLDSITAMRLQVECKQTSVNSVFYDLTNSNEYIFSGLKKLIWCNAVFGEEWVRESQG